MLLRLGILLIGFIFLNSHVSFAQFEEEEDSLIVLPEKLPFKYKPSVYLRAGTFHGFGNPEVFNQISFSKGIGVSIDNQRLSIGVEMDFFSFKNFVYNNQRKDRVYHIKGVINVNLLTDSQHTLYVGGTFGRLETILARYDPTEIEPGIAIYNLQKYWVASPQLTYYYSIPIGTQEKWMLKLGGYVSYSVPIQGYYPVYNLEKLPERELWHLDGALQVGVNIGITQLK